MKNIKKYEQVLKIVQKMDKHYKAGDFRKTILVKHLDGSTMQYEYAFTKWIDDNWIAVFTEHNGVNVFHKGDLLSIKEVLNKTIYFNNEDMIGVGSH